jgi:hypothetical protein
LGILTSARTDGIAPAGRPLENALRCYVGLAVMTFLAIDQGISSTKVLVVSGAGKVFERG